ncbi:uncharacterized protein LOC121385498 [Gigantopelta aegis]|uniref:uncharacterized protein LOC121385498 n=1 Tax=Gigantopelta aegis TaxID=1735272 RepID=UPI001B88E0A4|nr:uncharacterized protein LOC121385498 [Gigantopelta aegis]
MNIGSLSPRRKKQKKLERETAAFFEEVSCPLPEKKLVSKKTGKCASVLSMPLTDLHTKFVEESGKNISFSHFAKCRPSNVRPMRQATLRQCLCEYCTNVELKLHTINKLAIRVDNNCRVRHVYHAVDIITCDRENGAWQKVCAYRECSTCSIDKLDDHLQPLLRHQGQLPWTKWECQANIVNGKRVTRKMLMKKQGTMEELMVELRAEVTFLAGHLFRADWQHRQFESMRKTTPFPRTTVSMVLDFAENFTCSNQDEVQAAHWYHEQVTVHPIVTYYVCPFCEETISESLVFISDDRHHDFNAVFHFTKVAIDHLRNTRGLELDHIIQWTDGCASQYKSKGPFSDISCALADFGCTFEQNYFGSRHGKGPSDGESAVVKHHAATAVKAGSHLITNANDLFNYCFASSLNKQPEGGCKHF